jgi:hypothetical protein
MAYTLFAITIDKDDQARLIETAGLRPVVIYGTEWTGADDPSGESVLRSCVRVSWAPRRSDQDVVVGRRWSVSLREKTGARKIHLAAGHERNSGADARTVIYVA